MRRRRLILVMQGADLPFKQPNALGETGRSCGFALLPGRKWGKQQMLILAAPHSDRV